MNVAERALRGMLSEVGYYGPPRRLGTAGYPNFEEFVEMYGFLAYLARPHDVCFQGNPGRIKDYCRFFAPSGSSAAQEDGAGPPGTEGGNAGSLPASTIKMAVAPARRVAQP